MKKALTRTAFTLIELIISMVLVSIIMLGILSINTVLQNNNVDYGQRYLVRSSTQVTLNHILNNASLTVGNAGTDPLGNSEEGMLIGVQTGDANSFCFHQDIPPTSPLDTTIVNNPASSPPDYSNSRWLCYTWTGAPTYQLTYCSTTYDYTLSYRGASSCNSVPNKTFLGSAFLMLPVADGTFLHLSIKNCLDNTAASCSATGISTDPVNNPEVVLTGNVTASQESN